MRGTVIVFVKAPLAGRVKTRLGEEVGMGRAAALFRILTERTIAEAEKGGWRTILAIDPPCAVAGYDNLWPPHLQRAPQGAGDLGMRMARALEAAPPGPAVVIGADAPGLRARHLRSAFDALAGAEAVFGPAADGGYWLIGLSRRRSSEAPQGLFEGVRWSSAHALTDTLRSLPAGYETAFMETLSDIDEVSDLACYAHRATAR